LHNLIVVVVVLDVIVAVDFRRNIAARSAVRRIAERNITFLQVFTDPNTFRTFQIFYVKVNSSGNHAIGRSGSVKIFPVAITITRVGVHATESRITQTSGAGVVSRTNMVTREFVDASEL